MDAYIHFVYENDLKGSSISHHLYDSRQRLLDTLLEDSSYSTIMSLDKLLVDSSKLQHHLTVAIGNNRTSSLLASADSEQCSACLRSVGGREAGAWVHIIPSTNKLALDANKFHLAACLRLGLPLPLEHWATACDCSSAIDQFGYHLLTCKR